jgi:hypothetical protein
MDPNILALVVLALIAVEVGDESQRPLLVCCSVD